MAFSNYALKYKLLELASTFLNDNDHFPEIKFSRDQLTASLSALSSPRKVSYRPGEIFSSINETNGIKNFKFNISVVNSKILNLQRLKLFIQSRMDSILQSQGNLIKSLESELQEIELKYLEKADKVHVNNFSKERDKIIYNDSSIFRKDFKTNLPFEDKFLMEPFFGLGASLSLKNNTVYMVDNCVVIDEMTNIGDTFEKIFPNEDPNHVFRDGLIFRHAILKRSKDTTSRKYKRETTYEDYPKNLLPTLTLEADLESYCAVNYLEIDPIAMSGFTLKALYFFDGDTVLNIPIETKTIHNQFYVFFQTMYTRKIQFVFQQKVCIENTKAVIANKKNYHLNTALRGAGFFSGVEEDYEVETGYIYDLSIRSIKIGKLSFVDRGFLYSKPIDVENFLSCKIQTNSSYYGEDFFIENYLGLTLHDLDGNLEVESLIPLPDSRMYQNECLVLSQGSGFLKLYPDLFNNICLSKLNFEVANFLGTIGPVYSFEVYIDPECFSPEINPVDGSLVDFQEGWLIGPNSSFLGLVLKNMNPSGGDTWHVNILPFDYTYVTLEALVDHLNKNLAIYSYSYMGDYFFDVYKDDELLTLGIDYRFSLDGGSNWSDSVALYDYFYQNYRNKVAKNFMIEIFNEDANAVYTVNYKIDPKQVLNSSKNVFLENEVLKIDKSIQDNIGKCYSIFVCRAPKRSGEEIFILNSYQNKIYENDSMLEKMVKPKIKDLKINLNRSSL